MRALITGATGFIGSTLAIAAMALGCDVTAAGNLGTTAEKKRKHTLEHSGIKLLTGDITDPDFTRSAVAGKDVVIHLAAAQHESGVPDEYFRNVNVNGTRNLLEASRSEHVQRFVYGSTIGVYGTADDTVLDENSATNPLNAYTRSKLEAETVVKEFGRDMETVVARISETYGPGDMRLLKLFKAVKSGSFVMLGDGMNRRQCIFVSDLAQALLIAAQHPAAPGQTFVFAGDETLTTRSMVESIAAVLGKSAPRARVPMWPFQGIALMFESTFKPLGLEPPIHRRQLDFFTRSFAFSTVKAHSLLGFNPRMTFRQGAANTADWYRSNEYMSG